MDLKLYNSIVYISAMLGIKLSEEQMEVVAHFNDSMVVFANPGTGKTTTAVAGIIAAQTIHGIPGKKINAMSFTKLATAEFSYKYNDACIKCNITPTVTFNTFHSICFRIIRRMFPNFRIKRSTNIETELNNFKEFMKEEGVEKCDDMRYVKRVYNAMNALNAELLFSKSSVINSAKYIDISEGISLAQFQKVRSRWFSRNFSVGEILQGDIPLMTLYMLYLYPEVIPKLKSEYELMIVDEFQDMSVLYLEVLRLISARLIVIGDLKQQIYGFNGASLLILDAYKSMYPDAVNLDLTKSFRCKNEITELANKVIAPNEIEGYEKFTGCGDGAIINISNSKDFNAFDDLLSVLKNNQDNRVYNDIMFLSRNNSSVVPIIERLYKMGLIFRSTKFTTVMELPIFKELCIMADVALNPRDEHYVKNINKFFPEFKWVSAEDNPILKVMKISPRECDKNLLTINYKFEQESSRVILNKLRRFVKLNETNNFSVSCVPLLEIYEDYVIEGKWWKLDREKDYYFNLVNSIISSKDYNTMVYEEYDKKNKNEYYSSINEGIRCYTFHSSKGLEADKVYLLDVDDGVLPKQQTIDDLVSKGCLMDAARDLRNERNLLYVAITRCKRELNILYTDKISKLMDENDKSFYYLDEVYKEKAVLSNESKAFRILMGIGVR